MNESAPLQIVILGGTGDLANRKLLPALFSLYEKKCLPDEFSVLGLALSDLSQVDYVNFVETSIRKATKTRKIKVLKKFLQHISYVSGDFEDSETYQTVLSRLIEFESVLGTCTNKLYYLAVPPTFYETIFNQLHRHKLHEACDPYSGWARVLVEKPFGSDLDSAQNLDKRLGSLFKEERIYRIDHYLAKEAIQNILSFRFANNLLKGIWNRDHIEHVEIIMHETVDVGERGAFYDGIGAIRDVGQNHLLQLLALLTMQEPAFFEADHIRKERYKAINNLKIYNESGVEKNLRRAQYSGYKRAEGVEQSSQTETYFNLRVFSNDRTWKWVPFYISAGKALMEDKVEVVIHLKDVASGLFETETCKTTGNTITLAISPEQAMRVTLNAKIPGLGYQLESRTLTFDCKLGKDEVKNSYEKVLLDCIEGDQTLFTTTEEVLAAWRFTNPLIKHMHLTELQTYRRGSKGPKDKLVHEIED